MPQSFGRLFVHLIFSTKDRAPVLADAFRDELHTVVGGLLRAAGSPPVAINSVDDHIHALFLLSRTESVAGVVNKVKSNSSKWVHDAVAGLADFHWQHGYGAFSVSQSNVSAVTQYIENQKDHHGTQTFQEEYREFLRRHEIEFDERYVWD